MRKPVSDRVADRPVIAVRPDAELRALLEAAAKASGHSLSRECELRLLSTFGPQYDLRAIVREEMRAALDGMIIEKLYKRAS